MKQLLLLALLACSAVSCSKSTNPAPAAPAATATFTASRRVVEVNETVTFTNTSTGAARYEWSFGDGQTSTQSAPTVKYATTGKYTVTLKAYNSDGQASTQTFDVTVGQRYLTELRMLALNFLMPSGQPWDSDGTGPDPFVEIDYRPSAQSPILKLQLGAQSDITPAKLPVVWSMGSTEVSKLVNATCTLQVLEYSSTSSVNRPMFSGSFSVANPSADRDSNGSGTYTYQSADGAWQFTVLYVTQP